jgi:hypothetical protein
MQSTPARPSFRAGASPHAPRARPLDRIIDCSCGGGASTATTLPTCRQWVAANHSAWPHAKYQEIQGACVLVAINGIDKNEQSEGEEN